MWFKKYHKRILFSFFILLLILPFTQEQFGILKIKSLDGFYESVKKSEFTIKAWFEGTWQSSIDDYVTDNIGFRPVYVRIQNQILYSLFKKTYSTDVIIGKDRVLYQGTHIIASYGFFHMDPVALEKQLKKLKVIQKKLDERDISLLVLLAPGKPDIYPEYVPDTLKMERTDSTNYNMIIKKLSEYHINTLDMVNYFRNIKDTVKYTLYPKGGTHWSGYASTLVADTLFNYIREQFHYKINEFESLPGEVTDCNFRWTDNDLEKLLNVFKTEPQWELYYPTIKFKNCINNQKLNALVIGDSYIQSFTEFYPFFDSVFSQESNVWGYYKVPIWPSSSPEVNRPRLLDIIENKDIVILEATGINYGNFSYGFIDDAYFFLKTNRLEYDRLLNSSIADINNNEKWLESVKQKAITNNISLDEMIKIDASWMVDEYIKSIE